MNESKEKPKCDHKGQWGSLGTATLTFPDKIVVIHNLFCKECGFARCRVTNIPLMKSSQKKSIVVPNVLLRKPKRMD